MGRGTGRPFCLAMVQIGSKGTVGRAEEMGSGHQIHIIVVSPMEFGPYLSIQSCKLSGVGVSRGLLAP